MTELIQTHIETPVVIVNVGAPDVAHTTVVEPEITQVAISDPGLVVSVETPAIVQIEVGVQGPPGPPGQDGAAGLDGGIVRAVLPAAAIVHGHRALSCTAAGTVQELDTADAAASAAYVGLSLNAALPGDAVTLQSNGEMTEPSWAWQPGVPVWAAAAGYLTQTPPTTGASLQIGIALAATRILLHPAPPIHL